MFVFLHTKFVQLYLCWSYSMRVSLQKKGCQQFHYKHVGSDNTAMKIGLELGTWYLSLEVLCVILFLFCIINLCIFYKVRKFYI